jgi:hypothetical protein
MTFGLDLTSLSLLLEALENTLDLDLFSDLKKLRNGIFKGYVVGATNISNRTTPPEDITEIILTYVSQLGPHTARPLPRAAEKWKDLDYRQLLQNFAKDKNLESAKEKVLKQAEAVPIKVKGGKSLKRSLWLLDVLQMGSDSSGIENIYQLKDKIGKPIAEFLEILYGLVDIIPETNATFAFVKQYFTMMRPIGYMIPELAGFLNERFNEGTKSRETRQTLIEQLAIWNQYTATGLTVGDLQLFSVRTGNPPEEGRGPQLVYYDGHGTTVPFCRESELLEKYRSASNNLLFSVAEAGIPATFVATLSRHLSKLPVFSDNQGKVFLRTTRQHSSVLRNLIYKRPYVEVVSVLRTCGLALDFHNEDWKHIGDLFPRGTHFNVAVLDEFYGILSMFSPEFIYRTVAEQLAFYWRQDEDDIVVDKQFLKRHLNDLVQSDEASLAKFRGRFTMLESLYTLLGTTRDELLENLSLYAISATKPVQGKNPRPAKQVDWTVDTTLIWTNFTVRFRSEWVDRFNMTLSTDHDVEGREVLKQRAKPKGDTRPVPEEKEDKE